MALTNEMANFAEFTVEKRVEGVYRLKRIGLWAAYFIVPLAIMMVMFAFGLGAIALIVFIPLYFPFALPKIIYPATYRYVQIEYEYTIVAGDIAVNYIYGRRSRKEWLKPTSISNMTAIAPYCGDYRAAADAPDIKHRYEAVAYKDHPDNYYGIFYNAEGEKCVVIFQATNKVLKLIAFHNRKAVITQVSV
jgi:hypothetical protein